LNATVDVTGYRVRYRSFSDLAEDHARDVLAGRLTVPWTGAPPAAGAWTVVRLELPQGSIFDLLGVVSAVDARARFTLTIDALSRSAAGSIGELLTSPQIRRQAATEPPSSRQTRAVDAFRARIPAPRAAAAEASLPGVPVRTSVPPSATPGAASPGASTVASASGSSSATGLGAAAAARGGFAPPPPGATRPGLPPATNPPTHPSATNPSATHPSATHPSATHPSATHPSATHPSATNPSVSTSPPGASTGLPAPTGLRASSGLSAVSTASGRLPAAAPPTSSTSPGASSPAPTARALPAPVSVDDGDDDDDDAHDRYDDYDDDWEDEEAPGVVESDLDDAVAPGDFRTPKPGESYVVYITKFKTLSDFLAPHEVFEKHARMTLPYAGETAAEGALAELRIQLPGKNVFELWALVGRVTATEVTVHVNPASATFTKACAFPRTATGTRRLANERPEWRGPVQIIRLTEERKTEDLESLPLRRRMSRMSMEDKINMALSGGREERMALAMDGNKAVHHYLLKNARISLDEIAFIARLPTMNPDVLAKIGENPSYVQNQQVVKNLIYNPKTPVPLSIRLLDRLPRSEVMNLSKRMSMNQRLVQAAKKKLEGKSR
jgi:twinkle protein